MANELIDTDSDIKLTLQKIRKLIDLTNEIVNKSNDRFDDSWIERLWKWADENGVPDLERIKSKKGGYWRGLPRDKEKLLNLTNLTLLNNSITKLPVEIFNLYQLKIFSLINSKVDKLPKKIVNLSNLTYLILYKNPNLILTQKQKEWIKNLQSSGCNVVIDNDLFDRTYKDEIPF